MFNKFSEFAIEVMYGSQEAAKFFESDWIASEHILLSLVRQPFGVVTKLLKEQNITESKVMEYMAKRVGEDNEFENYDEYIEARANATAVEILDKKVLFTPRAKRILDVARYEAELMGHHFISKEHLLLAIINQTDATSFSILTALKADFYKLRMSLYTYIENPKLRFTEYDPSKFDEFNKSKTYRREEFYNPTYEMEEFYKDPDRYTEPRFGLPNLFFFGINLTLEVMKGKVDPVIGREEEIGEVIYALACRKKNNPLLIGEPGVGKSSIIHGLIWNITRSLVPEFLLFMQIYLIDFGTLLAGTKYRGEFEERIKGIIEESFEDPHITLLLDDLHLLMGAPDDETGIDAGTVIKPALSHGELQCIAITITEEFERCLEPDTGLIRRFRCIEVEEPTPEETLEVLSGIKQKYEEYHDVHYPRMTLQTIVNLSDAFIKDLYLPDKAVMIMDELGARTRLNFDQIPSHVRDVKSKIKEISDERKAAAESAKYIEAHQLQKQEAELKLYLKIVERPDPVPTVSEDKEAIKKLKKKDIERLENKKYCFDVFGDYDVVGQFDEEGRFRSNPHPKGDENKFRYCYDQYGNMNSSGIYDKYGNIDPSLDTRKEEDKMDWFHNYDQYYEVIEKKEKKKKERENKYEMNPELDVERKYEDEERERKYEEMMTDFYRHGYGDEGYASQYNENNNEEIIGESQSIFDEWEKYAKRIEEGEHEETEEEKEENKLARGIIKYDRFVHTVEDNMSRNDFVFPGQSHVGKLINRTIRIAREIEDRKNKKIQLEEEDQDNKKKKKGQKRRKLNIATLLIRGLTSTLRFIFGLNTKKKKKSDAEWIKDIHEKREKLIDEEMKERRKKDEKIEKELEKKRKKAIKRYEKQKAKQKRLEKRGRPIVTMTRGNRLALEYEKEGSISRLIRRLNTSFGMNKLKADLRRKEKKLQQRRYRKNQEMIKTQRKEKKERIKSFKKEPSKLDTIKSIPQIFPEDVHVVVAKWAKLPVSAFANHEEANLDQMESTLRKRLIGQDEAIIAVSQAIKRSRSGMRDRKRPIASFIFAGPTGVGKTELTKAITEFLFGTENKIIRIDMSEFSEKHTIAKLIGSPPGYVGYVEGGQLTDSVRKDPYSVVLLDEIEKAHPDLFNLMLQVLDDGHLTDSKGLQVDFTNTLIVLTTNLGSRTIQSLSNVKHLPGIGEQLRLTTKASRSVYWPRPDKDDLSQAQALEMKQAVQKELREFFRPEFLNRLDGQIIFQHLTRRDLWDIAIIMLDKIETRLSKDGVVFMYELAALALLAEEGYDPVYGARPLRRAVTKFVEDRISEMYAKYGVKGNAVFTLKRKTLKHRKEELKFKHIAFDRQLEELKQIDIFYRHKSGRRTKKNVSIL
mmetsp:Transcript_32679/g.75229  ORF Transcript_32679/g.75229 Transcript_32679/m.75229 type:complete len:1369 (-) Transcript_32679:1384-5490(-)